MTSRWPSERVTWMILAAIATFYILAQQTDGCVIFPFQIFHVTACLTDMGIIHINMSATSGLCSWGHIQVENLCKTPQKKRHCEKSCNSHPFCWCAFLRLLTAELSVDDRWIDGVQEVLRHPMSLSTFHLQLWTQYNCRKRALNRHQGLTITAFWRLYNHISIVNLSDCNKWMQNIWHCDFVSDLIHTYRMKLVSFCHLNSGFKNITKVKRWLEITSSYFPAVILMFWNGDDWCCRYDPTF